MSKNNIKNELIATGIVLFILVMMLVALSRCS